MIWIIITVVSVAFGFYGISCEIRANKIKKEAMKQSEVAIAAIKVSTLIVNIQTEKEKRLKEKEEALKNERF